MTPLERDLARETAGRLIGRRVRLPDGQTGIVTAVAVSPEGIVRVEGIHGQRWFVDARKVDLA